MICYRISEINKQDPNQQGDHVRFSKILVTICLLATVAALIPWYAHYLQVKALKQAETGNQVESLHIAEGAASYNPLSVQGRFVLAGAQDRLGRIAEARQTLVDTISMQPLNYETWRQLAIYERDKWGEIELSREHFAIAISLNPYDDHLQVEAGVKEADKLY